MADGEIQDHRTVGPLTSVDLVLPFLLCLVTAAVFMILEPRLIHWFIVPLLLTGWVVGIDGIRWLRGSLDAFDPKGIIGIFGLNFFFLSPLLVVYFNGEMLWVTTPSDWRPWIGIMGGFNFVGVATYLLTQRFSFKHTRSVKKVWVVKGGYSIVVLLATIAFSVVSLGIVMVKMGGISGLVTEGVYREKTHLAGLGTFRFWAGALMLFSLITLTIQRKSNLRVSVFHVVVILLVCLVVQFLTSGWLGSRQAVIYPIVWAVGIIHYYWRDLSPKMLVWAMVPMILFIFVYGLYKAGRQRFLDVFRGQATLKEVAAATDETLTSVLVGDLSRADIQAWMVFRWKLFHSDYNLRYGQTYFWAPFTLTPRWLVPWRPSGSAKLRAGTEYMYGKTYYDPVRQKFSSRVYGLAGEAILNFGLWSIPFAFGAWGLFIGYMRKKWISLAVGDSRLLLAPVVPILALLSLVSDSDVFWSIIVGQMVIPVSIVLLISTRSLWNKTSQDQAALPRNYEMTLSGS